MRRIQDRRAVAGEPIPGRHDDEAPRRQMMQKVQDTARNTAGTVAPSDDRVRGACSQVGRIVHIALIAPMVAGFWTERHGHGLRAWCRVLLFDRPGRMIINLPTAGERQRYDQPHQKVTTSARGEQHPESRHVNHGGSLHQGWKPAARAPSTELWDTSRPLTQF
jgi:hypothetical protein